MDDPWNEAAGRHARILGGYIGSNITPRICRVIATNNDCLLRDSPLIFHYYRRSSAHDTLSKRVAARNYKLATESKPESENIYISLNQDARVSSWLLSRRSTY